MATSLNLRLITPEMVIKALGDLDIPHEVRSDAPYLTYDDENLKKKQFIVSLPEVPPYKGKRKEYLQELTKKLVKRGYPAEYNPKSTKSDQGEIIFILKEKPVSGMRILAKFTKPGLKPSDIVPPITNDWITPEKIVENVKRYISTIDLDLVQKDQILDFMKKTIDNSDRKIEFSGDVLVPAEFFEILSAIKMAVLLRENEPRMREVLMIPKDIKFTPASPVKIYIPKKANYPLTDYEIAFLPSNVNIDKQPTFKVSVKSKVKSPQANTVKFKDIFESAYAVAQWFQNLDASTKLEQYGPELIASAAMKFYGRSFAAKKEGKIIVAPAGIYYDKVKLLFGIYALQLLIKNPRLRSTVYGGITSYITINGKKATNKEVQRLGKALSEIYKKMPTLKKDDPIKKAFPNVRDQNNYNILEAFISDNLEKGGKPGEPTIVNLIAMCERVLEYMSRKNSETKFNFFRMFYDKILLEKKIAYAVTSKDSVKVGKKVVKTYVKYDFYSDINWVEEYHTWIGLRRKDDKDMIGLDV